MEVLLASAAFFLLMSVVVGLSLVFSRQMLQAREQSRDRMESLRLVEMLQKDFQRLSPNLAAPVLLRMDVGEGGWTLVFSYPNEPSGKVMAIYTFSGEGVERSFRASTTNLSLGRMHFRLSPKTAQSIVFVFHSSVDGAVMEKRAGESFLLTAAVWPESVEIICGEHNTVFSLKSIPLRP